LDSTSKKYNKQNVGKFMGEVEEVIGGGGNLQFER